MSITTAAVAHPGHRDFVWESVTLSDPRPDEVLVRMVAFGICHTDLSALAGRLPVPLPAVLGHEGAGVVEAVGAGITHVRPGDRVVLSFTSCGECRGCRTGRPTRCTTFFVQNFGAARSDGSTPLAAEDGSAVGGLFFGQSSMARHAVVSGRSVVKVDVTDDDELAVLAPVGCGIQTGAGAILNVLRPAPGDTVAVFGAGAVGLSAVMAAALTGASRIIALDRVPARLESARELGATDTVLAAEPAESKKAFADLTDGSGVTFVVETTGVPALLELAAEILSPYGTVAVIGAPQAGSRASFDVNGLIEGRAIRGVTEGASDRITFIPALVDLFRQRRLPFDRLVRFYPPERLADAVEDARTGATVKPVIRFHDSEGER